MRCFVFRPSSDESNRFRDFFTARSPVLAACLLFAALLAPLAVQAQAPAASPPAPQVQAPETNQQPTAPTTQPQVGEQTPPVAPVPQPIDLTAIPALVPIPKDPPEVQEVEIPAKPAAIISGESTWDDSVVNLAEAFKKLNEALDKAGKKAAGRPIAVFTKSTDDGFSYDAMIPLADAPAVDATPLGKDMRYGTVPTGKALRFIHRDPYELISSTYEGISLYVEKNDLIVKEELIEEYITDITNQSDKNTIVNIYMLLDNKPAAKQQ